MPRKNKLNKVPPGEKNYKKDIIQQNIEFIQDPAGFPSKHKLTDFMVSRKKDDYENKGLLD